MATNLLTLDPTSREDHSNRRTFGHSLANRLLFVVFCAPLGIGGSAAVLGLLFSGNLGPAFVMLPFVATFAAVTFNCLFRSSLITHAEGMELPRFLLNPMNAMRQRQLVRWKDIQRIGIGSQYFRGREIIILRFRTLGGDRCLNLHFFGRKGGEEIQAAIAARLGKPEELKHSFWRGLIFAE